MDNILDQIIESNSVIISFTTGDITVCMEFDEPHVFSYKDRFSLTGDCGVMTFNTDPVNIYTKAENIYVLNYIDGTQLEISLESA